MRTLAARMLCGLGAVGAAGCGPAFAQRLELVPFADIQQIGTAALSGGGTGDNVTYTEFSTGLGVSTNTRRIVASGTYRFSYRLVEAGNGSDNSQHAGTGRIQMMLIKNVLTLEGGALVTMSRVDAGGASPQFITTRNDNLTQTYTFYAQPTMTHRLGPVDFVTSYRYGYVTNDSKGPAPVDLPPNNRFSSSTSHQFNAQIGMGLEDLPFAWSLAGQHQRENATDLAQHFRSSSISAEVKVPIGGPFAAVASGGYEKNTQSQREALIDPATGAPVFDDQGRFVADPSQPRKLIYETDGLIADAGIIWRPSQRTRVEARAGYRYSGLTFSGLAELRPDDRTGFTLVISDRLSSFGRQLTGGLASTPVQFDVTPNDPSTGVQNCLFGQQSGTGSCLGGALGQAAASSYRDRSASFIFSRQMRRMSVSMGGGYTRRTYIDDPDAAFSLDGVVDQLWYAQASATFSLARQSGVNFAFSGNLFNNGQVGVGDVTSYSFNSSYFRTLGRGLQAQASLGLEYSKQDGLTADISGRAQLGVHYNF